MVIINNDINFGVVKVVKQHKVFDMESKTYKLQDVEVWEESKDTIVAEDFTVIPKNHCRACKNPINAYRKQYLQRVAKNTFRPYSFDNCYCEQCAIERSKKNESNSILDSCVVWRGTAYDGTPLTEYSDGTIVEG
jgi:hypothetical protein